MDNTIELINLVTACFSLVVAVASVVLLFKNQKNNDRTTHTNLVKNNSGIVNQYGNSYNYTDNRTHINETKIVYTASSSKNNSPSGDFAFILCCGLLVFPFNSILEEYQWILRAILLLVQLAILFCIYKNVRISLPSSSAFTNVIFFVSPLLLIIMSEIPSFFGLDLIDDFNAMPDAISKIFQTGILLLRYVAFLLMFSSHISSLISPKISSPKIKSFFEKGGHLWEFALFFQILSIFIILMITFII